MESIKRRPAETTTPWALFESATATPRRHQTQAIGAADPQPVGQPVGPSASSPWKRADPDLDHDPAVQLVNTKAGRLDLGREGARLPRRVPPAPIELVERCTREAMAQIPSTLPAGKRRPISRRSMRTAGPYALAISMKSGFRSMPRAS